MSEQQQTPENSKEDEPLREEGYRALLAEREQVKELKRELKALQDAKAEADQKDLSERDKAIKRAEAAEARLKEFEQRETVEKLKKDVAKKLGMEEYADLLAGTDEESLKAHAEKLKAALGPQKPEPNRFLGPETPEGADADAQALNALGFGN